MAGLQSGVDQLVLLSRLLKDAGETGLRRDLLKAISDTAKPLAREIGREAHLRPYMPNRYAAVLAADLDVTVSRRTSSRDPGVTIRAKGRSKGRKVQQLDDGILHHPLFGDRERWFLQLRRMKPGFFTDPAEKAAPDIREALLTAMHQTAEKITSGR